MHASRFSPSYEINLPGTELPLGTAWLLPLKAQPRRPVLCPPSPEEKHSRQKHGALEATNLRCRGRAGLLLPAGGGAGQSPAEPLRTPSLLLQGMSPRAGATTMQWGGRCLHTHLDPRREMEYACSQHQWSTGDNAPSKRPARWMCAIGAVADPPDEATDRREGEEGTSFELCGPDRREGEEGTSLELWHRPEQRVSAVARPALAGRSPFFHTVSDTSLTRQRASEARHAFLYGD